ncbi:YitT family protein [Pseudooceanicola sediminis]|uniref:YitT family protein n=1 Tax=Pseudooceanicola sediminis TaxID=2211117 RepID=A0A399J7X9_9RHOB|nr:YitT family protein [Pseudooceanicola sediminis]KAA2316920.1 YitT family protein [Puniceibacterium sp. HSS470]RII40627.1 YitT family protein [Pseudooceanicola sediminis]|tara:strand:+ start:71305 stop:71919 length:615 start_codon:yes stop_codon:yes gene_type:complete
MTEPTQTSHNHSLLEDVQGVLFGATMAGLGIVILTHLGLVTGQTAGLAVLISYVTGWSFGPVFFVLNIPFYWLGYSRMGLRFTIKTFIAVALLSVLSKFLGTQIVFDSLTPWTGAVIFGMITGAGLLALFRHGASLGGVGILALYLQEKTGFRAGYTQLCFDACVFIAALFVLPLTSVIWSLLGAVIINLVIAINHRKDWYVAT